MSLHQITARIPRRLARNVRSAGLRALAGALVIAGLAAALAPIAGSVQPARAAEGQPVPLQPTVIPISGISIPAPSLDATNCFASFGPRTFASLFTLVVTLSMELR